MVELWSSLLHKAYSTKWNRALTERIDFLKKATHYSGLLNCPINICKDRMAVKINTKASLIAFPRCYAHKLNLRKAQFN